MRNGLGMGLGISRARGGGEKYTDIELPLIENIIRAWSTRRLIPGYKDGIAIKADRTEPVGDDGFAVKFGQDGTILVPDGGDAYAYELHEQTGIENSKLFNTTFANCPKVLESNVMKKGLDWSDKTASGNNNLYMSSDSDAAIETAFLGSFSLIVWSFIESRTNSMWLMRAKINGSGSWAIRRFDNSGNRVIFWLSASTNLVFTPTDPKNTYEGKWASFGIVVDRAQETDVSYVYLNGVKIGTHPLDYSPVASSNTPLRIGGALSYTNAKAVNDLAIWDTALTDEQMQAAHDAMAPYYAT